MGGYILVIPNDSEITSLEILFIKNNFFQNKNDGDVRFKDVHKISQNMINYVNIYAKIINPHVKYVIEMLKTLNNWDFIWKLMILIVYYFLVVGKVVISIIPV